MRPKQNKQGTPEFTHEHSAMGSSNRYLMKSRLLKFVMCPLLVLPLPRTFLRQPLKALTRQQGRWYVLLISLSFFRCDTNKNNPICVMPPSKVANGTCKNGRSRDIPVNIALIFANGNTA